MTISFYFAYFFSFRIFLIIVYNSSDLCFFVSWVPCFQDIIQFRGCLPMTPLTVSITAELKFAIMELRSVFSTAGTMCSSNLRSVLVLDYQILHSFSFLQTQHTDVCSNRFRRIYFLSAMYDWQTYRMYEIMTQWARQKSIWGFNACVQKQTHTNDQFRKRSFLYTVVFLYAPAR